MEKTIVGLHCWKKINEIDGHNLSFVFSIGRFLITANTKKAAGATNDITAITEN